MTSNSNVVIQGDISAILSHRRANRILKDTLDCTVREHEIIINNVTDYPHCFNRIKHVANLCGCEVAFDDDANEIVDSYLLEEARFSDFSQQAKLIRNNQGNVDELKAFERTLLDCLPSRTLYDLQLLSAYHLAFSQNSCNFSVPGAGKTSVVYGAYAYLHSLPVNDKKHVDKLLIVGPLSSFAAWENEYTECFGKKPRSKRLTAEMSLESKKQLLYESNEYEIILLSYASVSTLINELTYFLKSNHVMMILDEAHKIKNVSGGVYAESVLSLSPFADSRVVLTGTPAPNGYEDLYNLFHFIWPTKKIIKYQIGQLRDMSKTQNDPRVQSLMDQIEPYFIRVKKSDLHIPDAINNPPILVPMKENQRRIYDFVESSYMPELADSNDQSLKSLFAQARLIRLMQAATNPALLSRPLSELPEYSNQLPDVDVTDDSIMQMIMSYSKDEIPAKFEKAYELTSEIITNGGKVVIWATFIKTLDALSSFLFTKGIYNRVLYGATPVANDGINTDDEEYSNTREAIINEFNDPDSGLDVIIANPFAVAESISLHKACHNAIYLERSFNAAHFMQSKDRIHRYGLPKDTITNYYYLVSEDSVDETIDERLQIKERRMMEIIENMPIPLFRNIEDDGNEDIKAVLKNYARRIKTY